MIWRCRIAEDCRQNRSGAAPASAARGIGSQFLMLLVSNAFVFTTVMDDGHTSNVVFNLPPSKNTQDNEAAVSITTPLCINETIVNKMY